MSTDSNASNMQGPSFIIIGAMKSATSSIHDQLNQLPGISMSDPKEPNFFSDPEHWEKGFDWYHSLFDSMPESDLKGESSTHYTKLPTYPECADRLYSYNPNLKLVYVMRDPIQRIVSQYIHEWSMHNIDKDCSINDAIDQHPILIQYSSYANQIRPYIERFGIDQILPVFFERIKSFPTQELNRITKFVGYQQPVQWIDQESKNVSSQRQRRSKSLNLILDNPIVQLTRRTLLPESLRAKIRARWTMQERPELNEQSINRIESKLDSEMQELEELLGMKLTTRGFADQVMTPSAPNWAQLKECSL